MLFVRAAALPVLWLFERRRRSGGLVALQRWLGRSQLFWLSPWTPQRRVFHERKQVS